MAAEDGLVPICTPTAPLKEEGWNPSRWEWLRRPWRRWPSATWIKPDSCNKCSLAPSHQGQIKCIIIAGADSSTWSSARQVRRSPGGVAFLCRRHSFPWSYHNSTTAQSWVLGGLFFFIFFCFVLFCDCWSKAICKHSAHFIFPFAVKMEWCEFYYSTTVL